MGDEWGWSTVTEREEDGRVGNDGKMAGEGEEGEERERRTAEDGRQRRLGDGGVAKVDWQ